MIEHILRQNIASIMKEDPEISPDALICEVWRLEVNVPTLERMNGRDFINKLQRGELTPPTTILLFRDKYIEACAAMRPHIEEDEDEQPDTTIGQDDRE